MWWIPERSTERSCLQVRALLGYFSTPLAVSYGLALKQGSWLVGWLVFLLVCFFFLSWFHTFGGLIGSYV